MQPLLVHFGLLLQRLKDCQAITGTPWLFHWLTPVEKRVALARAEEFSHEVVWSPGVLADPDKITWNDINGMEAYFSANNFRNRYIPAAIGCRLAGLAAFERGIELAESIPGGVRGFMVCEDDFMLKNPELFLQCFKDLPDDADALWLDTSSLRAPTYDLPGTCLRRNHGGTRLYDLLAFGFPCQGDCPSSTP